MAITTLPDVEAEYATKRDQIVNYEPATLDDDLAKLETLAVKAQELVKVAQAREALNGRPTTTEELTLIADAAGQLLAIPDRVRSYISQVQAQLTAEPPPAP